MKSVTISKKISSLLIIFFLLGGIHQETKGMEPETVTLGEFFTNDMGENLVLQKTSKQLFNILMTR